jgi:hypothetical protein
MKSAIAAISHVDESRIVVPEEEAHSGWFDAAADPKVVEK